METIKEIDEPTSEDSEEHVEIHPPNHNINLNEHSGHVEYTHDEKIYIDNIEPTIDDNIEPTIDYETFLVDLINNYTSYYKKIFKKPIDYTIFDGIDTSDATSTNRAMEDFFTELCTFRENESTNPSFTQIIKYEDRHNLGKTEELYTILQNGMPLCVSQSLFALLVEITNLKNENKSINYEIISLK